MDRTGRPRDVAPVVAFPCGDESAWIRGANIPLDGGMFAHLICGSHGAPWGRSQRNRGRSR